MEWNVACLTIVLCLVAPASARAQWAVLDSTEPRKEVGLLSQVGEQSFVLLQVPAEAGLWIFEINSNGFKQGSAMVYYQDDSCLGTPYLDVVRNSGLVIHGLVIGDQIVYTTAVGQPMTFISFKTLPGGSCQSFPSTITAAPMLTRPLFEISQFFAPPFVLWRY
jgi:hypothetical protein